jgi:2'-5' RNA ligase
MRLFAAIPVVGEGRVQLEGVLARLSELGWPVRWVRPEQLHLTVKFLGEVEAARVAEVSEALAGASAGVRALAFGLRELGTFPGIPRARVVWAGLEAEPALELMVDRIERACHALGFPIEGRPFRPHVTLGRVLESGRLPREAGERLAAAAPTGNFVADRLVLYHSRLGPGGPRYESLENFPLGS